MIDSRITNASLVVVGSGIKYLLHLTTEAIICIKQADKVLYLVNNADMEKWIQQQNINAESLVHLYTHYSLRLDAYHAISDYILTTLRQGSQVCVVLYGHPTVFAKPALDAVMRARQAGYSTEIFPGISAEDCLFADLAIDPGNCGCQSFETTDFLIHRRQWDNSSHLILWQVGVIGVLGLINVNRHKNTVGQKLLWEYLSQQYSNDHVITLYHAAQSPDARTDMIQLTLAQLSTAVIPRLATLYVPPARKASLNKTALKALGIDKAELETLAII